jgi:hypothetical protein
MKVREEDEGPVEIEKLGEGGEQGAPPEELGAAMEAGIVVHAHFGDAAAGDFDFADEFDADGAAGGGQMETVEEFAADEAEVAVDIADADVEEEAGEAVVNAADEDAVPGVVAEEFVAVDEPGGGAEEVEEFGEFGGVILAVAVGVEDEGEAGGGEAGAESAAVAAVDFVGADAEAGGAVLLLEGMEDGGGFVVTAVVDDDHLKGAAGGFEGGESGGEQARQGGGVVISGEEDADAFGGGGAGWMGRQPCRVLQAEGWAQGMSSGGGDPWLGG